MPTFPAVVLAFGFAAAEGYKSPHAVVFVCEHGTVKSVIAAEIFNRRAAERKLPFRAVSRGVNPDPAVPAAIAENLAKDGFDVSGFKAAALAKEEASTAARVVAIGIDPPLLRDTREIFPSKVVRWSDIPPASTRYAAARDEMARRVEVLLDTLEKGMRPVMSR